MRAVLYLIFKARAVWHSTKLALAAFKLAFRDGVLYGTAASAAEVAECGGQCPICHDAPQAPVKLPCGHMFCSGCLEEWAQRDRTCPMCRKEFRPPALTLCKHGASSLLPKVF